MSSGFTTRAYRSADLVAFATALFERAGLGPDQGRDVGEVLVEGDLLGHSKARPRAGGGIPRRARGRQHAREGAPAVVSDHGGATCWDGRRLPGPMAGRGAIEQALARVPAYGIAAAAIRESHHIGCLTAYLERAAAKAA